MDIARLLLQSKTLIGFTGSQILQPLLEFAGADLIISVATKIAVSNTLLSKNIIKED